MTFSRRLGLDRLAMTMRIGQDMIAPDVFICCSSFEGRSTAIASAISELTIQSAIIFSNTEFREVAAANTQLLTGMFAGKSTVVPLEMSNPLTSGDSVRKAVAESASQPGKRYLVDVTTFTHELLLILIRVLHLTLSAHDTVQFAYTTAVEYSIGDAPDSKWLTKGIGEIRSVLGFPGLMLPARKLHLIVLAGYEGERAERLIDNSEPNQISLGLGEEAESITPTHYLVNAALHKRLAAKYSGVETFKFSPADAIHSRDAVIYQALKYPDHNVAVAPLNTKVSTVGCALAALQMDGIQLCYATAHQYNVVNYSARGTDCIVFDVGPI